LIIYKWDILHSYVKKPQGKSMNSFDTSKIPKDQPNGKVAGGMLISPTKNA
jgi:hypothetical protein